MPALNRDGVTLAYDEAGVGSPPMLLVHGFAGDRSHVAPLFDYFRQSRRVVAVDRRGHGASDAPDQEYPIALFADDLAWTCRELGLYQPVVVVHSQDKIAFDLAARYPDLASALVLIDTPSFPPPPVAEAFAGFGQAVGEPYYLDALRGFAASAFAPDADPARREAIIAGMTRIPQHVLASTWRNYATYDLAAAAAACRIPVLHIGSWFPADTDRLRSLCPQLVTARVTGAGHFAQLDVPDQVSTLIDQFVASALGRQRVAA